MRWLLEGKLGRCYQSQGAWMLSRENRAVLCCAALGDGSGAAERSRRVTRNPQACPLHTRTPPLPPPFRHSPFFKALVMFLWVTRVAAKEGKEAQEALCLGCSTRAPRSLPTKRPPRLAVVCLVALPFLLSLPPSCLLLAFHESLG